MKHIIQMLLCAVLATHLNCADIPVDEVQLQVFDTKPRTFEKAILESLETTTNFWADESVQKVIGTGSAIVHFLPYGEAITTIVGAVTDLLQDESDWKPIFVKALEKEQHKGIIMNQIEWFTSKMNTMKQILPLLDKEKEPNNQTRITYAFSIHENLHTMLDYYNSRKGLFRKYPQITAPLLINLGLLVTVFTPLSNELIPSAAKQLPITCDALDVLWLYRSLTTHHRLQRTNLKYLKYPEMMNAINLQLAPYPRKLSCDRGCKKTTTYCESKINKREGLCSPPETVAKACEKTCVGLGFNEHSHCIKDEFGADEFDMDASHYCLPDYTSLVVKRVENLFPIQYLNTLCKRDPIKKTGSGWVTILVGVVSAFGTINGGWCDIPVNNPCDPYVKIYINDEPVDQTSTVDDTYVYDADHQFISAKIEKSSIIKIEVWDDDGDNEHDLAFRTEGNVEDFIAKPYRYGNPVSRGISAPIIPERNSINLKVLWEDEFVADKQ